MEMIKKFDGTSRPIREVTHKLAAWRKHFGLTAAGLADKAGLTGSFVSLLESGRAGYTQNSLEALAKAMGIEPWQLLGQDPGAPDFPNNFVIEAKVWESLSEVERGKALRLAKHLHEAQNVVLSLHVADLAAEKERRR